MEVAMAGKKGGNQSEADRDVQNRAAIAGILRRARNRLRRREAWRALVASFWVPVFAATAWVLLVRYTFFDVPRWPVLVFFSVWLIVFFVWVARLRITPRECAHYLDKALDLDERVTTLVEMEGRARIGEISAVGLAFKEMLAADTAMLLATRLNLSLPSPRSREERRIGTTATTLAVLVLVSAALFPTALDAVKTERDVVRVALDTEAQKLADLRAEIVKRPDVPDDLKNSLTIELDALQARLRGEQIDRAEALATIADAEEKIRNLSPDAASADFSAIVRSAGLLQNAVAEVTNSGRVSTGETSDLSSAEEAIKNLLPRVDQLTTVQARGLASDLERAANAAIERDPQLAQNLLDAAAAIRSGDGGRARAALDEASKRYHEATAQRESAEAVENALAKLEDGRQGIAKAGTSTSKRGQVGFRRGSPGQAQAPGSATGDSQSAGTQGGPQTPGQSGALGGQNQPAYGLPSGGQNGQGQNPSQGGGGTPGGQPGQAAGGAGSGQQPQNAQGSTGDGSIPGGGNVGRVNGPVRVTAGSGAATGDAAGYGVSGDGSQASGGGDQPTDRIYVPGQGISDGGGTAGQAAPEPSSAASGRVGDGAGGDASQSSVGLGSITTIHTPYTQVLGQYSEQAIEALDRAYVPPDAKEYVRDYFSALGK
jgi:hypothetical protein